jgi:hypothetical protein
MEYLMKPTDWGFLDTWNTPTKGRTISRCLEDTSLNLDYWGKPSAKPCAFFLGVLESLELSLETT